MKINEIFLSLQGEGAFVGYPAIFIRVAGCNLSCEYCDTKYAFTEYKEMTSKEVFNKIVNFYLKYKDKHSLNIDNFKIPIVIFTGGEPMLQVEEISDILNFITYSKIEIKRFMKIDLETNGTILRNELNYFDYISFSPKRLEDAEKIYEFIQEDNLEKQKYDIKIVTDGNGLNEEMFKYATMLMPLTTFNKERDKEIKSKVWSLCIELGKKYSPRIHIDVFGAKRGV